MDLLRISFVRQACRMQIPVACMAEVAECQTVFPYNAVNALEHRSDFASWNRCIFEDSGRPDSCKSRKCSFACGPQFHCFRFISRNSYFTRTVTPADADNLLCVLLDFCRPPIDFDEQQ